MAKIYLSWGVYVRLMICHRIFSLLQNLPVHLQKNFRSVSDLQDS